MILTLEVMGPEAAKLGAASRKVFNATGGTIGRQPDNSWVLLGPYVSSRHAVIRYADGVFYIEDTSRNGIFINSQENRLGPDPYVIQSGDVIFIEPFEIRASIASPAQAAADPFPFGDLFSEQESVPARPARPGAEGDFAAEPMREDEHLDPLQYFRQDPQQRTPPGRRFEELSRNPLDEHYNPPAPVAPPPAVAPQPGPIPVNYDPSQPDSIVLPARPAPPEPPRPAPVPPRPRPRRPSPPIDSPSHPAISDASGGQEHSDLTAVLKAAGLPNVSATPELARDFGEILRIVVSGVMDVLETRNKIKDEFRIRVTTVQRADKNNNPLKLSADVDDALHNLLVKRNPRYLGPVEAFGDAFEDIRNHQMAMLAGMRAAFHAMLAEFEPDKLQEEFDRQLKVAGPQLVPAKLRYWELYQKKVHDMVRDAEATFRELFGDQFADAYEEQLKRLKAPSRSGR